MDGVEADCPGCGVYSAHSVLKQNGLATVQCRECGHTHKIKVRRPELVTRRVVVSQGGSDAVTSTEISRDEQLVVGEERVLETDTGVFGVEITSLEIEREGDNQRADYAKADEVSTIWTKSIDYIDVPVTVHVDKGEAESIDLKVPGDYRFTVGEEESLNEEEFTVTGFVTEQGNRFRLEGDDVQAKNAKRIYAER